MATPSKNPQRKPPETLPSGLYRTDAARYLGVSLSTVKRFEREGLLVATKNANGENFFDIPQLEALKAERSGHAGPETEAMVATIDTAGAMSVAAQKHIERMLNVSMGPAETGLEFLRAMLADVRAECDRLRTENFALLTKMAELIKADRQEALEEKRIDTSDNRKQQAIGLLKQAIPMIIAQVGGNKQLGSLLEFIQSLDAEQIKTLIDSGFLTAAQAQSLSQVLSESQKSELASPSDTSETETVPE